MAGRAGHGRDPGAADVAGVRAVASSIRDESAARVAALAAWRPADRHGPARVLVASVQALFQHTLSPRCAARTSRSSLESRQRDLAGARAARADRPRLRGAARGRAGAASSPGAAASSTSSRPGQPLPVRIEWFGDEIESLRAFDPADQRGVGAVDEIDAAAGERVPARRPTPARSCASGSDAAAARLPDRAGGRPRAPRAGPARRRRGGLGRPLSRRRPASTTSATRSGCIDEPADVAAVGRLPVGAGRRATRASWRRPGELPKAGRRAYPAPRDWKQRLRRGAHARADLGERRRTARRRVATRSAGTSRCCRRRRSATWPRPSSAGAASRLRVVLASRPVGPAVGDPGRVGHHRRADRRAAGSAAAGRSGARSSAASTAGFAGGPDGLVLVTDRELFGTVRVRRPRVLRRVVPQGPAGAAPAGRPRRPHRPRHRALRRAWCGAAPAATAPRSATSWSCSSPRAAASGCPVEQIERVSRYAGGENPHLSRLGGGEWQRTKTRVRKAVTDLAKELLELYSARDRAQRPRRSAPTRRGSRRWRPRSRTRRRPTS